MSQSIRKRRWVILCALMLLFIIGVSYGADIGVVPTHFMRVPFFDKLGHFTLYGLLAFLLHLALKRRGVCIGRLAIPIALVVVCAFGVLDEAQQYFSPYRASDITDLGADLLGILVFVWAAHFMPVSNIDRNPNEIKIMR